MRAYTRICSLNRAHIYIPHKGESDCGYMCERTRACTATIMVTLESLHHTTRPKLDWSYCIVARVCVCLVSTSLFVKIYAGNKFNIGIFFSLFKWPNKYIYDRTHTRAHARKRWTVCIVCESLHKKNHLIYKKPKFSFYLFFSI